MTKSGFYGPDGPYHCFAGHDATVNLAKSVFDAKYLDDISVDLDKDLTRIERDDAEGYLENFTFKYRKIGWLKEWREHHRKEEEEEEEQRDDDSKEIKEITSF